MRLGKLTTNTRINNLFINGDKLLEVLLEPLVSETHRDYIFIAERCYIQHLQFHFRSNPMVSLFF